MFWYIVLTALTVGFGMLSLWFWKWLDYQRLEIERLNNEIYNLRTRLDGHRDQEQWRREQSAYSRGLYDGRQTDALYRNILKKYSARDQANVMMNGTKG